MSDWIKTSERLPPNNHDVIGHWEGLVDLCCRLVFDDCDKWFSYRKDRFVTIPPDHWQEMPEPIRKEEPSDGG